VFHIWHQAIESNTKTTRAASKSFRQREDRNRARLLCPDGGEAGRGRASSSGVASAEQQRRSSSTDEGAALGEDGQGRWLDAPM
jgi:hypothetical protein